MKQDDNINVVFTVARTRNNAVPLVQKLATTFGEYAKYVILVSLGQWRGSIAQHLCNC